MDMARKDLARMGVSQHCGTTGEHGGLPNHESMGICTLTAAATNLAVLNVPGIAAISRVVSTDVALPPQPFMSRGTIVPTGLPRGPPALV